MPENADLAETLGDHGPALLRAARSLLRTEADAEDAVQDAMVAVLRAPHLLGLVERTGGWLYTVVRRRCLDILRRGTLRSEERAEALEALFDDAPDAAEHLERQELVLAVADAVSRLDAPLRFAFVENALEGRTFKEISAESGIPMGTLMARKYRAVEAIRKRLCDQGLFAPGEGPREERRR